MYKCRITIALLLLSCKLLAQADDLPDPATFLKAFNVIRPEIENNFADIKGDLRMTTYFGKEYFVKKEKLPGTAENYIMQMDDLFDMHRLPVYTAPIDTTANEEEATDLLKKWKILLMKVFPKEAKTMEESGTAESKTHDFVFVHPAGQELDANNKKYQSKGWMLILRNSFLGYYHHVELYIGQKK